MATSGNVYSLYDSHVYLKRHGTLDPFVWGGRCMRLEDGTETLGGLVVTTRQDPRGGVERDGVRMEPPGATTTSLVMKRLQRDTMKTVLKTCLWDVDKRLHCSGIDRDSPFKWEEINRYCIAKMSDRTLGGSSWEGDDEDMVTFSITVLYVDDFYRVTAEAGAPLAGMTAAIAEAITDVTVCQPDRCPGRCDPQEECVVVAVTEADVSNSHLMVNLYGGDLDAWTDPPLALTGFGANDASAILCLGEFIVAVSTADTSIIYSDDRGTTQVEVDQTTYSDWSTNSPVQIDAIDQTFIVMCGLGGYVYGSVDGARTWTTLDAANATAFNLGRIMIARDNPSVIYAISNEDDAIIKSENGGENFFSLGAAPTGTSGILTALWVIDQSKVLVGTDDGEIFETLDGGENFTEQLEIPGLTTKADTTISDITGCGCGDLYLTASNDTGDYFRVYRNVDGGASGRWFVPDDHEDIAADMTLKAIACCGTNHAIAVGGHADTADIVVLVK